MKPTALILVPLQGLAGLRLGASRKETHAAAAALGSEVTTAKKGRKEIEKLFGGALHLHYAKGRLEAIECWRDDAIAVTLDGADVLRGAAAVTLRAFEALSPLAEATERETSYMFPELSIGLWRPRPSDPTFSSVLVGRPGYYLD